MKLVTNDYGCGTSSSILDYGIEDVVVVSEQNYQHVFDVEDDLFFIGHDFLFYLWDNEDNLKKWIARSQKHEHWVWCFERIDAIVPAWQHKSHVSLTIASKFCKRILACDEEDCDKYELDWLPQWASNKFFDMREKIPTSEKILFSGQAGKPEYFARNKLISEIVSDPNLVNKININNVQRTLSWEEYIANVLHHKTILNPIGILKALNTRAYEVLYCNRILLQHTVGRYKRHELLLKDDKNIVFFESKEQLNDLLNNLKHTKDYSSNNFYNKHNLFARMKSIGLNIK